MPLKTLALLVMAAVIHASWNAGAKAARGNAFVFVWANASLSSLVYLPLALVLVWTDAGMITWHIALAAIVSGVLHIGYALSLQTGYAWSDLGVVYPTARGVGPLLTMVVAVGVLGEKLTPGQVVGALGVIGGIMIVAASGRVQRSRVPAGVAFGTLTGTMIAGYTLWDNHAVVDWNIHPIVLFVFSHAVQAGLMTPGALRRRRHWPESITPNRWPILLVALLAPVSYILVLYAMKTAPVSLVAPVRETSIVIGALLGWLVFKEPRPQWRVVGAAVVLAGVALIATG